MSPLERPAPPVGEEIHLPSPTGIPLVTALGITILVVGLTFHWVVVALGALVVVIAVTRWIRDVRRDIDELPIEH